MTMLLNNIFIFFIVIIIVGIADASNVFDVNNITNKVFIPGENNYVAFRIPGIKVVDSKNILVFAEGRRYGCSDYAGEHDIVFKRSLDAGKTWSKINVLMNPYEMFGESICPTINKTSTTNACQFWDPTPVYDKDTKILHVLTAFSNSAKHRMSSAMWVYSITSNDLGATWNSPTNITNQILSLKYGVPTPSNGHGIQLSNGKLIVPNYVKLNGVSAVMSGIFYSDNHGKTWQFAETSLVGLGTSESEVVELYPSSTSEASPVSTLLFNHRRAPNAQIDTECDGKSGNQDGCRWQSISHDGGMTFNHFHAMPHLPDPSNKGGICRYKEKRALLFTNTATDINQSRVNVTLRISYDNGNHWSDGILISYWGGYSDVETIIDSSGKSKAAVIYENNTCAININLVDLP